MPAVTIFANPERRPAYERIEKIAPSRGSNETCWPTSTISKLTVCSNISPSSVAFPFGIGWVVWRGAHAEGWIRKFRDTRSESHPWQVFARDGGAGQLLETFYKQDGGLAAASAFARKAFFTGTARRNPPEIRSGAPHARSYGAHLPLRPLTDAQLVRATAADKAEWKRRPLTYIRQSGEAEWAALEAEWAAGLTESGRFAAPRKTGGGETGRPHARSSGAHLPMRGTDPESKTVYAWPPVKRNPPGRRGVLVSKHVVEIRYVHAANGRAYRHPFGRDVCAELLPDGSVRLYHAKGKPLMAEY